MDYIRSFFANNLASREAKVKRELLQVDYDKAYNTFKLAIQYKNSDSIAEERISIDMLITLMKENEEKHRKLTQFNNWSSYEEKYHQETVGLFYGYVHKREHVEQYRQRDAGAHNVIYLIEH